MIDDETLHPCPLSPEDRAWLERQDKAMLIAVIGQLAAGTFAWRAMLDEAILRGYRNGLQASRNRAIEKANLAQKAVIRAIESSVAAAGYIDAVKARDRAERVEESEWRKMEASWNLRPGFHRGGQP